MERLVARRVATQRLGAKGSTVLSATKPPLLLLSHRIPYPPNKGDKIRSYHLLRYLSEHYRVYLGAFVDDHEDWQYASALEEWCEECCLVGLNPLISRFKSLSGLLSGKPLSMPYYRNRELQKWVSRQIDDQKIEHAVVYSSPMAQYIMTGDVPKHRVADFVDIDSDKWRQYAEKKRWPMNWVYRREARTLLKAEREITRCFDASLFVSSAEAALFKTLVPELADKIGYYNNGVDADYFSPQAELENPYTEGSKVFVFTGAMDYWPNVDAVQWFANSVLPALRQKDPGVRFYIVGGKPTDAVKQLAQQPGIVVTGRVPDVRPYLQHAVAAVAPMRIARGIQNKVLEAMAMEKITLVSSQGLEGIEAGHEEHVILADTEEEMISYAERVIAGNYRDMGKKSRQKVTVDFNWAETLPVVGALLEKFPSPENAH